MRGLDEREFLLLDRAVRRADGERVPDIVTDYFGPEAKSWDDVFDALTSRGLTEVVWLDVFPGRVRMLRPTPLGRIALRVERLIRNGGALKGAA